MRPTCLLIVVLSSSPACTGPVDPPRAEAAATKEAASRAGSAAPIEAEATRPVKDLPVTPVPPPVVAGPGPVPQPVPEPVLEPLPELVPPTSGEAPPPASDAGLPAAPTVPAATEPATVPVQAVAPARTTVVWREVARPGEAVTFEPLIRGVLGRSAGGYHDEDDSGALVLRPEIEAPAAPVLGIWPDNAWFIETRVKIEKGDRSMTELRQLRLMRLRGKRRWVPQAYNGEQRFEDDGERFQIGGTGGLIVESRGSLTRLADNAVDPVMGLDIGGELVAFFETKSGRVYPVRSKDGALHVQRDCADLECVATEAIRLPLGTQWSFTQPVTRQQHSISSVAEARIGEGVQAHLLHYEAGGWKLESLTAAPTGLWPTKDGGLWAMVGEQLLHRDPNGGWREVVLPAGATSVSAAMRGDSSELWIAANIADRTVVFGTAAAAQSSPPAPGMPG